MNLEAMTFEQIGDAKCSVDRGPNWDQHGTLSVGLIHPTSWGRIRADFLCQGMSARDIVSINVRWNDGVTSRRDFTVNQWGRNVLSIGIEY